MEDRDKALRIIGFSEEEIEEYQKYSDYYIAEIFEKEIRDGTDRNLPLMHTICDELAVDNHISWDKHI